MRYAYQETPIRKYIGKYELNKGRFISGIREIIWIMRNPFNYGGPVGKDAFCNRKAEVKDLKRAIENAERMFIYSERRTGKTSLVSYILNSLPRTRYIAAYVDLWRTDSEESFAMVTAAAMTKAVGKSTNDLLKAAERFFKRLSPSVVLKEEQPEVIFSLNPAVPVDNELEEILTSPAKMAEKLDKRVVVAFDEFQRITEYGSDRVERILRSVIQWQSEVSYLFLGSRKHIIKEMVTDKSRPFYRSGSEYPLGPIDVKAWIPFIKKRFQGADKQIDENVIRLAVEKAKGHPYYVQRLCHAMWEVAESGGEVTADVVEEAINLVLERSRYTFTERWESLNVLQRRFLAGLSKELPGPQVYSGEFIRKYGLRAASNVNRVVEHLLKRDVIDRDNGSFVICDRFFTMWIYKNCLA